MRMSTPLYSMLGLALSLLLLGCSDNNDDEAEGTTPTLMNAFASSDGVVGSWRLLTIETRDTGEQAIPAEDTYRIQFADDGSLEGIADCNYFHGTYTTNADDQLRLGPLEQTRAACDLPSYWHRYLAVLQSALRYERMGDRLVVHSTLSAQLVFAPAQQSD